MSDSNELGAAMVAAARQHAASFRERPDGTVEFNAWWRGGESLKVRVWPWKGSWADIKAHGMGGQGSGGNAKAFAEVALGMTLPQLLERYGSGAAPAARAERQSSPASQQGVQWAPGEAQACWLAHLSTTAPRDMVDVADWLQATRGIPLPPVSGMVPLQPALIPALPIPDAQPGKPATVRAWVEQLVDRGGPAVLLPLWSASGTVDGLVIRFRSVKPGEKKSMNLRGLRRTKGRPLAFGLPHRLKAARAAVVVEGAPDTWAAECLLREHLADPRREGRHGIAVLGVDGVSQLREWAESIGRSGVEQVVMVPQLDAVSLDGMHALGVEVAKLGVSVRMLAWEPLLQGVLGCGVESRPVGLKDLADLARESSRTGGCIELVVEAFLQAVAESGQHRAA